MRSTRPGVMFFMAVVVAWLAVGSAASASHGPPVLVSTGPSDNSSDPVTQILNGVGISNDGSRIFFTSSLHLVPGDEDGICPGNVSYPFYGPHACADVYERSGGQTTLLSTGSTSGIGDSTFAGASDDGSRVFFESDEPLVAEDANSSSFGRPNGLDVYERSNGQTTLISTGPRGNSPHPSFFLHASPDGARVLFSSVNPLVPEDTNTTNDVYERYNGTTTLISTGPSGPGNAPVRYVGASKDGTRVFFLTDAALVPSDTDSQTDLYERSGGQTTLLSTGPSGGNGPWSVPFNGFAGASEDGTRVFFATQESLVPSDTDSCGTNPPNPCLDIYERSGGQTTLVSTGPNSGAFNDHIFGVSHVPGVVSADGSTVYFETDEPLVSSDTDGTAIDVYKRSEGQTTLVSTGPAGGNSPNHLAFLAAASRDGQTAFFRTDEALVASDTDNAQDIYERMGSTTTLVSTGPIGGNADLPAGIDTGSFFPPSNFLPNPSLVFFRTAEALVPDDTNTTPNVYERSGGQTSLVPAVPGGGGAQQLAGLTPDGRTALWYTTDALVPSDTDTASDLYAATVPNRSPDCSGVTASRPVLTTVSRRLVAITLDGASDPDGDSVTLSVDGVTQDEPVLSSGDHTAPDAVDEGDGELRVRAERNPHGDGRVYRIAFTASDGRGGSCTGTATVSVPRKRHKPAVDSAPPSYDSFTR